MTVTMHKPATSTQERTTPDQSSTQSLPPENRQKAPATFLVVGYGHALQEDEGTGYAVVKAVGQWGVAYVKTQLVKCLTPQLIDAIAQAEYVLFVSAGHREHLGQPQITPIDAEPAARSAWPQEIKSWMERLQEPCTPQQLLGLTQAIYGQSPQAWSLAVPTKNFGPGAPFSATAAGIAHTLDKIATFLRCYAPIPEMPARELRSLSRSKSSSGAAEAR